MDTFDGDGAIAAAKYFLELAAYALGSGDTDELQTMSDVNCQFCANLLSDVNRMTNEGSGVVGGEFSFPTPATQSDPGQPGNFLVALQADSSADATIASDGSVIGQQQPSSTDFRFAVTQDESGWIILEVVVEQ